MWECVHVCVGCVNVCICDCTPVGVCVCVRGGVDLHHDITHSHRH